MREREREKEERERGGRREEGGKKEGRKEGRKEGKMKGALTVKLLSRSSTVIVPWPLRSITMNDCCEQHIRTVTAAADTNAAPACPNSSTHTHTRTHSSTHARTCARHTHTNTHANTHARTHTHTRAHARARAWPTRTRMAHAHAPHKPHYESAGGGAP